MENKSENKSFNPATEAAEVNSLDSTKVEVKASANANLAAEVGAASLSAPSGRSRLSGAEPKAEDEAMRKAELKRKFLAIRRFKNIGKLLAQLQGEIAEFNKEARGQAPVGENPIEDSIITTTTDYSEDIVVFVGYRLWELIYHDASRYTGQPIEVVTEKCVSAYNDEPFTRYAFTFDGITLISHKDD